MATTAHNEKQKRRFFSFYKPRSGNRGNVVLESKPTLAADKNYISQRLALAKEPKALIELEAHQRRSSFEGRRREIVEGRKSVSHVETKLASVSAFLQVKVLVSDMPELMQVHAFRCARTTYYSMEKFSSKHIAFNIKKEFDRLYGPAWHCIVGSSFGSFVTHSTGCFLYFSMEKLYILLFKTKINKVED